MSRDLLGFFEVSIRIRVRCRLTNALDRSRLCNFSRSQFCRSRHRKFCANLSRSQSLCCFDLYRFLWLWNADTSSILLLFLFLLLNGVNQGILDSLFLYYFLFIQRSDDLLNSFRSIIFFADIVVQKSAYFTHIAGISKIFVSVVRSGYLQRSSITINFFIGDDNWLSNWTRLRNCDLFRYIRFDNTWLAYCSWFHSRLWTSLNSFYTLLWLDNLWFSFRLLLNSFYFLLRNNLLFFLSHEINGTRGITFLNVTLQSNCCQLDDLLSKFYGFFIVIFVVINDLLCQDLNSLTNDLVWRLLFRRGLDGLYKKLVGFANIINILARLSALLGFSHCDGTSFLKTCISAASGGQASILSSQFISFICRSELDFFGLDLGIFQLRLELFNSFLCFGSFFQDLLKFFLFFLFLGLDAFNSLLTLISQCLNPFELLLRGDLLIVELEQYKFDLFFLFFNLFDLFLGLNFICFNFL